MTDTYNLDDVQEDFGFILNGHEYRMRYPNTEETMKAQDLEGKPKEQMDWFYKFIKPVKSETPDIKEVLEKASVKKLQKFTEMIATEFGGNEK